MYSYFIADAKERISIKLSIVVCTQNSSGSFSSGSHIFSENYLLQEPEISLLIFSNKVEFCTHFVALTQHNTYIHIVYIYIYIYLYLFIYKFIFKVFQIQGTFNRIRQK